MIIANLDLAVVLFACRFGCGFALHAEREQLEVVVEKGNVGDAALKPQRAVARFKPGRVTVNQRLISMHLQAISADDGGQAAAGHGEQVAVFPVAAKLAQAGARAERRERRREPGRRGSQLWAPLCAPAIEQPRRVVASRHLKPRAAAALGLDGHRVIWRAHEVKLGRVVVEAADEREVLVERRNA